jgi:hypothetical protein
MATTDGSFITTPLCGTKTNVFVVPKSIPIFFTNILCIKHFSMQNKIYKPYFFRHNTNIMKKSFRRFLFFISLVIFALVGAVLVIYAQGFKFDFSNWHLVKTGSLQLQANTSADIYINDKLVGNTSFFSNAFTKGQLLPKNYTVRMENPDYKKWQKTFTIEAGMITDFPRIVLIPVNLTENFVASSSFASFSSISFNIENNTVKLFSGNKQEQINLNNGKIIEITPSPTPKPTATPKNSPTPIPSISPKIISPISNGEFILSPDGGKRVWYNEHEILIEWLKATDYQPYMPAGQKIPIITYSSTIKDVQWYSDSAHLFVNINGLLKFMEIDIRGGMNSYDITTTASPFYYSKNQNAVFKFNGNQLVKIDL